MSVGPIPWTAVHEYARNCGLGPLAAERFHRVIEHLDAVYMKWLADEREKKPRSVAKKPHWR